MDAASPALRVPHRKLVLLCIRGGKCSQPFDPRLEVNSISMGKGNGSQDPAADILLFSVPL